MCPFCAEEIRSEAVFCRFCRSRLDSVDTANWHRGHAEARLAGVCVAIAKAFSVPVAAVRLAFIVFSVFFHVGILVYAGLWLVIPPTADEPSHAERGLQWALDALHGKQCSRRHADSGAPEDRKIIRSGHGLD